MAFQKGDKVKFKNFDNFIVVDVGVDGDSFSMKRSVGWIEERVLLSDHIFTVKNDVTGDDFDITVSFIDSDYKKFDINFEHLYSRCFLTKVITKLDIE